MQVSLDTRADLLRACSDAIEGLGRLSDALDAKDVILMAMVAATYRMLRSIERVIECRGIMS